MKMEQRLEKEFEIILTEKFQKFQKQVMTLLKNC